MKAQITRNKNSFLKLFFANYAWTSTRSSLQYLVWLKSKTVKIYSVVKSVKLLLVLSICNITRGEYCFNPLKTGNP